MIEFQAILYKITTTVDGGWRVTLDIGDNDQAAMMDLSKLRQSGLYIKIQTESEAWANDERRNN